MPDGSAAYFACAAIIACYVIKKSLPSSTKQFVTDLIHENTNLMVIDPLALRCGGALPMDAIIVHDDVFFSKVVTKGELGLAESYMDGDWDTADLRGTIVSLLKHKHDMTRAIRSRCFSFMCLEVREQLRRCLPSNTVVSAKSNISHHYDVGNDLYTRMLGKHMMYTCAYFNKPDMSLDEAQMNKMELIAKKLDLKPNIRVLDIGCGFGAMAHHLATKYEVDVVGVTLSIEQKSYADMHYPHTRVTIELKDYRRVTGTFDRIYSIGMFEHVGRKNYHEYYDKCHELLSSDGIMLTHTIGTNSRVWDGGFVNKYIFPGGQLPHIENLTGQFVDRWHLEDWQSFGMSYAKTLTMWRENIGDWSGLDQYDTRFRRMWDFYLQGCAATFDHRGSCLWQIVYTKKDGNRTDDCHHIRAT